MHELIKEWILAEEKTAKAYTESNRCLAAARGILVPENLRPARDKDINKDAVVWYDDDSEKLKWAVVSSCVKIPFRDGCFLDSEMNLLKIERTFVEVTDV